jgi:hypothetical protein
MEQRRAGRAGPRFRLAAAVLALAAGIATAWYWLTPPEGPPPPPAYPVERATVSTAEVRQFCSLCHAFPSPDLFPRRFWKAQVELMYFFFTSSKLTRPAPPQAAVVKYFEDRAPAEMPPLPRRPLAQSPPVRFERQGYPVPGLSPFPAISNVSLCHLFDNKRPDILVCDMRHGRVMAFSPYAPERGWRLLGEVPFPAHAEVVDLDGDGIKDVLVANLGNFLPTDDKVGSVVWLRGRADGTFQPVTLLRGVGRVADVQAADFDGDGKLDLLVAVFGWRTTGEIRLLRNRTTDWAKPEFVSEVLDYRHGTIHVPVADLNGDGKPDFVALISQEHETVVAFLNEGGGKFRKEIVYQAPHPAYGSSGIQLVDLNGDGKWDVLYTNGDVLDSPFLKPYHGVQWLENRGTFPFTPHPLAVMPGVHRALAADFRGRGVLDIVAVAFLPQETFSRRTELGLDSVLYLEQVKPGQFVVHSLEQGECDYVTCAVGDVGGDGRPDLVLGRFNFAARNRMADAIRIWKNLGPPPPR